MKKIMKEKKAAFIDFVDTAYDLNPLDYSVWGYYTQLQKAEQLGA